MSYQQKKKKKLFLIFLLCCSIGLIYFPFYYSRLQIEVYNRTNFDIDSLKIDGKFYKIPKNKFLLIEDCEKLTMQGSIPFGIPEGKINGMKADTTIYSYCGEGIHEITHGKYKFDIRAFTGRDFYTLNWDYH